MEKHDNYLNDSKGECQLKPACTGKQRFKWKWKASGIKNKGNEPCVHNKAFLLRRLLQQMDFCVNGATQGAGEAPAIDTKIHLLYTSGKQKCIIKCHNPAGGRF